MLPKEYVKKALATSVINWSDQNERKIAPLGLLGELGSVATVLKRSIRDGKAYSGYKEHLAEECGDLLWYLMIIAYEHDVIFEAWPTSTQSSNSLYDHLVTLEKSISDIITDPTTSNPNFDVVHRSLENLEKVLSSAGLDIEEVAKSSVKKIESHWLVKSEQPAANYDNGYPSYERLPRVYTIDFLEIGRFNNVAPNELIMSMDGMHLGDRLTDNNHQVDGYRYHDIFHLCAACCLGWSPVFRRMLKKKRKSNPKIDEVEDGARAAILEEAIVGHIFAYARANNFLAGMRKVDSDLIKLIQSLVQGYEVESAEPWEWQDYILKSMSIFRQIRKGFSGQIEFDANRREVNII